METIQILDENALAEISLEATKYTHSVISRDPEENSNTIYDLKRELLIMEQSMIQERLRLIEQAKKRENRITELELQVGQLKRQIK